MHIQQTEELAGGNDIIASKLNKRGLTKIEAEVAVLFYIGELTSKQACEIINKEQNQNVQRREFEERILATCNLTSMRNNRKNPNIELNAAKW